MLLFDSNYTIAVKHVNFPTLNCYRAYLLSSQRRGLRAIPGRWHTKEAIRKCLFHSVSITSYFRDILLTISDW